MNGTTHRHVAIWIDRHEAILLILEANPLLRPMIEGPDGRWSQHRVDARQHQRAQSYYEAVLSLLGPRDEIFILGPDGAKRKLLQRIEDHEGARGTVVGIHDASRLSGVDLVYPTGEVWRAREEDGVRMPALMPKPEREDPGRWGRSP